MPNLAQKFVNATAWARKDMLRVGQLLPANADTSHIVGPEDWQYFSLTSQVNGSATSFTLPQQVRHIEEVRWADVPVLMGNQYPGFTLANDRVTVTTNFTPDAGDELVAKVLL